MSKYLPKLPKFLKSQDFKETFPKLYFVVNMLYPVEPPQAKEPHLTTPSELHSLINEIVTDFANEVHTANLDIYQEICDKYSNSKFADDKILISPFLSMEEYVLSLEREAEDSVYRIKKMKTALKFKAVSHKMALMHLHYEASMGEKICKELNLLKPVKYPAKPVPMSDGKDDNDGNSVLKCSLKLIKVMEALAWFEATGLTDLIDKLNLNGDNSDENE